MKITDVRVRLLSYVIPPERRHRNDYGWVVKHDTVIVEVKTDEGITGIGTGIGRAESIKSIIEHQLCESLLGEDPIQIERLWTKMYAGSRMEPSLARGYLLPISGRRGDTLCAIAAIDIALWDIWGKVLNQPIYKLLGAARHRIRAYASGGWAPGAAAGDEIAGYIAKGFTAAKMRAEGRDGFTIEKAIRRIAAAREAIGPDIELMVDAHGSLDVSTAIQLAKRMEPYNVAWFEEPISPDNHSGLAEVRRATSVPIATGESEFTRFDFLSLLEQRAVDVVQPDIGIAGGFTEVRRILALASAFGVKAAPHNWGSGILFAASLHMVLSAPNCYIMEVGQAQNPLIHEIFQEAFDIRDGYVYAPERPGLGYTLADDLEERFPFSPGPTVVYA
ncbi:MAG TPA: mandelate racemase/muconate lactonizing enzyme family protein [Caldilineaceae bacterium]|nr:mandelate racemase/muconate lactonizing enzyme family protein [Caldilineaceae bacterium]